ncbi:MAG: T9SS type A sorting domain-containing protein [Desulfonauticus sp.]|nr:T9SS type A sorting domain-containing protein [Desulfonauticus sp.]
MRYIAVFLLVFSVSLFASEPITNRGSIFDEEKNIEYKVRVKDTQSKVSAYTHSENFTVYTSGGMAESILEFDESFELTVSRDFILYENYPNPFNPQTKISFGLPEQSNVSLKVYDINGKNIATLAEGSKESGYYTATFGGTELTSGVYIYKFAAKGLETGNSYNEVKRMLLIK